MCVCVKIQRRIQIVLEPILSTNHAEIFYAKKGEERKERQRRKEKCKIATDCQFIFLFSSQGVVPSNKNNLPPTFLDNPTIYLGGKINKHYHRYKKCGGFT